MRKKLGKEKLEVLGWLGRLDKIARKEHDGHYTLFGFTGGYKVVFGTTVDPREYLDRIPQFGTLAEAIAFAIDADKDVMDYCDE